MPELAEPLLPARVIGDPTRYEPLAGFSCVSEGEPWEQHVDRVAGRLATGEAIPQILIALEDSAGALVGIASFWLADLILPLYRAPVQNVPYINVIGTDSRYRGQRLADGARPGDALLTGALALIGALHGNVHVFALVAPDNAHGHALFARHSFGVVSPLKAGRQAIRIRPPQPA